MPPRTRPHPPTPASALHLVLRVAISPRRHLCVFPPPSVNPSRHRPRLCLGDIPPLLAQPPPRFVAADSGYGRRVYRPDIQHILRIPNCPSRITDTLRRIRGAHRRICRVLWRKHLFDDARTHLACHLRTREYPPRRQCGESCVV
jgi:hypothetical protein